MLLTLPSELIHEVISRVVPAGLNTIFSTSSSCTRDLLLLTLVCKTTNHIANKLLVQYCLDLSSARAATCLANGLLTQYSDENQALALNPTQVIIRTKTPAQQRIPHSVMTIWHPEVLDTHVAAFDTLFSRVGHCLTRLVLNSFIHASWSPYHNTSNSGNDRLREPFKHLMALEEFYCIQLDGNVCCIRPDANIPLWTYWPKLRRLALIQRNKMSESFLKGLSTMQNLTHLFLVGPGTSFDQAFSHSACGGPATFKRIIIVQPHGQSFASPHSLIRPDRLLWQMKAQRLDRSTTNPGKISIMTLFYALWHGIESWFLAEVRRGTLWELETTTFIKKELEI